jgi:hypothetical protein
MLIVRKREIGHWWRKQGYWRQKKGSNLGPNHGPYQYSRQKMCTKQLQTINTKKTQKHYIKSASCSMVPHDHLSLDRSPNIGPLISRWELDKFRNCWNKTFRTSKILMLLCQQFLNLLISQQDMSGPRLGALSNNRWLGGRIFVQIDRYMILVGFLIGESQQSTHIRN